MIFIPDMVDLLDLVLRYCNIDRSDHYVRPIFMPCDEVKNIISFENCLSFDNTPI